MKYKYLKIFYIAICASPVVPESHLQINQTDSQLNDGQYNGTVSFYCDSGYKIDGNDSSTCHFSGVWIPQPPKCVPGILVTNNCLISILSFLISYSW